VVRQRLRGGNGGARDSRHRGLRIPAAPEAELHQDLHAWAERIRAQPWSEVFVFFKHEDKGIAPRLAARFLEAFGAGERPGA
jgi:uncharacterized protein YecE (DUF72 family)